MAKTKTKPGPKPKYGEREEIHALIPASDLAYIRNHASNLTEWVIEAIKEKREKEEETRRQIPQMKHPIYGPFDKETS